jgi:hypothetical protein
LNDQAWYLSLVIEIRLVLKILSFKIRFAKLLLSVLEDLSLMFYFVEICGFWRKSNHSIASGTFISNGFAFCFVQKVCVCPIFEDFSPISLGRLSQKLGQKRTTRRVIFTGRCWGQKEGRILSGKEMFLGKLKS